ncbi:adenylate kinase isoenzyme 5 [Lepeophtheirus salmonis]|uniref:adenylate kinase isoenzyme 5 n=1 Tax=Lepeophtheirus salmonis TaxID=72036 RepID=UPI001AEADEA8|nr:adenylate kinase isoenzyme 5-like [Lepeophtheirus salmonis]
MGICLDTEYNPNLFEEDVNGSSGERITPVRNKLLTSNDDVLINVPVIFVLGGPGSGKISHCEAYAERHGCVHIGMTDEVDQMLRNIDVVDYNALPKEDVLNRLIDNMEERPSNKCYLISGYPRNMNDLGFYLEKIGRVDGVIFINWHESSLENQIRYGASIGQIEEDLALAEFENFKSRVISVTEYFDYKSLLHEISGDRKPEFVYEDFENCVFSILDIEDEENILLCPRPITAGSYRYFKNKHFATSNTEVSSSPHLQRLNGVREVPKTFSLIYIIGGPGSTKTNIIKNSIMSDLKDWHVISTGEVIFKYLSEHESDEEAEELMAKVRKGESFPNDHVMDIILNEINRNPGFKGYVLVGFPRDIEQSKSFEKKINFHPPAVLIDCSELTLSQNLGRRNGRPDDNLYAYKMRLNIYRKSTLPLLKHLDDHKRLHIIDGDASDERIKSRIRDILISLAKELTGEDDWTKDIQHDEI